MLQVWRRREVPCELKEVGDSALSTRTDVSVVQKLVKIGGHMRYIYGSAADQGRWEYLVRWCLDSFIVLRGNHHHHCHMSCKDWVNIESHL